jgi:hypothetical protein
MRQSSSSSNASQLRSSTAASACRQSIKRRQEQPSGSAAEALRTKDANGTGGDVGCRDRLGDDSNDDDGAAGLPSTLLHPGCRPSCLTYPPAALHVITASKRSVQPTFPRQPATLSCSRPSPTASMPLIPRRLRAPLPCNPSVPTSDYSPDVGWPKRPERTTTRRATSATAGSPATRRSAHVFTDCAPLGQAATPRSLAHHTGTPLCHPSTSPDAAFIKGNCSHDRSDAAAIVHPGWSAPGALLLTKRHPGPSRSPPPRQSTTTACIAVQNIKLLTGHVHSGSWPGHAGLSSSQQTALGDTQLHCCVSARTAAPVSTDPLKPPGGPSLAINSNEGGLCWLVQQSDACSASGCLPGASGSFERNAEEDSLLPADPACAALVQGHVAAREQGRPATASEAVVPPQPRLRHEGGSKSCSVMVPDATMHVRSHDWHLPTWHELDCSCSRMTSMEPAEATLVQVSNSLEERSVTGNAAGVPPPKCLGKLKATLAAVRAVAYRRPITSDAPLDLQPRPKAQSALESGSWLHEHGQTRDLRRVPARHSSSLRRHHTPVATRMADGTEAGRLRGRRTAALSCLEEAGVGTKSSMEAGHVVGRVVQQLGGTL